MFVRMPGIWRSCIALCALLLFSSATWAGALPQTHDGFFLRLNLVGVGGATTTGDDGSDELEFSGAASMLDLAIGGMITDNLALHGTLFGWLLDQPTVQLTGYPETEANGTVTMGALGIGITRFFMPSNVYLSGSIGLGAIEIDPDLGGIPNYETDAGLALQLLVGKEWWVGDNWGLGVAGALGYHNVSDEDDLGNDVDWTGANLGLMFSVTFN